MPARKPLVVEGPPPVELRISQDYEWRCRSLDRRVRVLNQDRSRLSVVAQHADLSTPNFDSSFRLLRANRTFMLRFWPGSNPGAPVGLECHRLVCRKSRGVRPVRRGTRSSRERPPTARCRDAMPNGGMLAVHTANVILDFDSLN